MARRQRRRGRGAAAPGVGLLRITGSRQTSGRPHRRNAAKWRTQRHYVGVVSVQR